MSCVNNGLLKTIFYNKECKFSTFHRDHTKAWGVNRFLKYVKKLIIAYKFEL